MALTRDPHARPLDGLGLALRLHGSCSRRRLGPARPPRHLAPHTTQRASGIRNVNRPPSAGRVTVISPPALRATRRASASPSPAPSTALPRGVAAHAGVEDRRRLRLRDAGAVVAHVHECRGSVANQCNLDGRTAVADSVLEQRLQHPLDQLALDRHTRRLRRNRQMKLDLPDRSCANSRPQHAPPPGRRSWSASAPPPDVPRRRASRPSASSGRCCDRSPRARLRYSAGLRSRRSASSV